MENAFVTLQQRGFIEQVSDENLNHVFLSIKNGNLEHIDSGILLIVDDNQALVKSLCKVLMCCAPLIDALMKLGVHSIATATAPEAAIDFLKGESGQNVKCVLIEENCGKSEQFQREGLSLLMEIRKQFPFLPIIIMSFLDQTSLGAAEPLLPQFPIACFFLKRPLSLVALKKMLEQVGQELSEDARSSRLALQKAILKQDALQELKARYFHGAKFDLQKWSVLPCRVAINTFVNSEGSYDYEMDNIKRVLKELNSVEWWTPLKDNFQQFCADFLTPLAFHGCPEVKKVQTSLEQFLKYVTYIRRQSASKIPSEKIGRIRNRSKAALRIIKGIETAFEQLRRKLESNNNLGGASNG
jgi:hypothetical protein